jgi:hypothetical protein
MRKETSKVKCEQYEIVQNPGEIQYLRKDLLHLSHANKIVMLYRIPLVKTLIYILIL